MGHYLLDTHTAMWFFNGDNAISDTANQIILDLSNFKYLSIASAWELAIKIGLGKLEFNGKSKGFISLAEEMTLITVDENIQQYEVSQIW